MQTLLERIHYRAIRWFGSDRRFAEVMFKRATGNVLNLTNPQTFAEKIHWLKLFDRNPLYTTLADKYAVRRYVSGRVGEQYLNSLLGVYERVEDIDPASLPQQFVLKATHGSRWNVICTDKSRLDWDRTVKLLRSWMSSNYYRRGREWVYKNVPPRIICEAFLSEGNGNVPKDFKIFCFGGVPRFIQVDLARFEDHMRAFYSVEWDRLPFSMIYRMPQEDVPKPENLDEMLRIARSLAMDIPFCRIDLYSLPRIIFGEMTFYPENGYAIFDPPAYNEYWGGQLNLPFPATEIRASR